MIIDIDRVRKDYDKVKSGFICTKDTVYLRDDCEGKDSQIMMNIIEQLSEILDELHPYLPHIFELDKLYDEVKEDLMIIFTIIPDKYKKKVTLPLCGDLAEKIREFVSNNETELF